MGFATLSDEDVKTMNEAATAIKEKKKFMLEFIESLRDDFSNVDTQEQGLTKLYEVLKQLPDDCLDDTEVGSLLEFLLTRLEASALRNGCVVTCIHHLILHSKNLPKGCEIPIFQAIYSESTVQCFTQPDRAQLFEILEFFLEHRRSGLQSLGSEFILCFMRAANGERDPRCLLQIFKLYLEVVKDFDLGVYCEDLFELLAVYFPLEYTPTDALKISREMLVSGLESCLLSHKSFSFYCFQLISSKLLEEETEDDMKVEICGFLAKAARIFPSAPMKPFLDDFLTVFRRLCLNPSNKTSNEIPVQIRSALLSILKAFEGDTETTKNIAHTMTENCEPFILQAEMGLTGKALSVLSVVAEGSQVAAEMVLPQIMFWLSNLINADTVNAPQNRQEIITEAITFLPEWLELSIKCKCIKVVTDAMPGFIESLKRTEEAFGSVVFPVEYKVAEIILNYSSDFKGEIPSDGLFEKLIWRSVTDLKSSDAHLKKAVHDFAISFAKADFKTFAELVEKELATRSIDASLLELISLAICDCSSADRFGKVIIDAFKNGVDFDGSQIVIGIIDRNKNISGLAEKVSSDVIDAILETIDSTKSMSENDVSMKAELLQELFLRMNNEKKREIVSKFISLWKDASNDTYRVNCIKITYLPMLQLGMAEPLEEALGIIKSYDKLENVTNQILFALTIYDAKHSESTSWISVKAALLLNRPKALTHLESFFESFISSSDVARYHLRDLFDFDSPGFDPAKNKYPVSLLWRQRILCQFIPVYVKYFSKLDKDDTLHKSAFLELLNPILSNAQKLTVPLSSELLLILPILTEALELLVENESSLLDLVVDGFVQLLKQASIEDISQVELQRNLLSLQQILKTHKSKLSTVIKVLDALEMFGKKAPAEIIAPAYTGVIGALKTATTSNKRIIRQKAANVRNQWELAVS